MQTRTTWLLLFFGGQSQVSDYWLPIRQVSFLPQGQTLPIGKIDVDHQKPVFSHHLFLTIVPRGPLLLGGNPWGTICDAKNKTQVDCRRGKCPICCSITPPPKTHSYGTYPVTDLLWKTPWSFRPQQFGLAWCLEPFRKETSQEFLTAATGRVQWPSFPLPPPLSRGSKFCQWIFPDHKAVPCSSWKTE